EEKGDGACVERAAYVLIAPVHRQDNDASIGIDLPDLLDGIDPIHSRQPDVHQRDIRQQASKLSNRFRATRGKANDFKARMTPENGGDAFAHDCMVVNAEDPDSVGFWLYCAGTHASTSVPFPFPVVTCRRPPTRVIRSCIPFRPHSSVLIHMSSRTPKPPSSPS